MKNEKLDVSARSRKPNGQFDNEFATLKKGPDPLPQEKRDWSDLYDIPEHEVSKWQAAGFSADQAHTWGEECGFYPDQAQEWRLVGFHDPYVADEWSSRGFDPKEAREWIACGFASIERDRAPLWRDAGFPTPKDAQEWREAGFNHAQALAWVEEGMTCDAAKEQSETTGIKLHHAPEMYMTYTRKQLASLSTDEQGWGSPYGLYGSKDWIGLGFSPDAAAAWQSIGYNPHEAFDLRRWYVEYQGE